MKHYGISQWVDFVRGLVPESTGTTMRNHLGGCSECRDVAEFCENLQSVLSQAASDAVPEWVVRRAKAIFPVPAEPVRKRSTLVPIELIYDSFSLPAVAGLRATWQVGWQALYRAGDCSLDLRIEPELASERAVVIGQISNHIRPGEIMEGIPVRLRSGKVVVAETRSNRFGEFLMEYEEEARLQLCIYLEDRSSRIQVPLKKFGAARVASEPASKSSSRQAPETQTNCDD
jgi:hypothetical protein